VTPRQLIEPARHAGAAVLRTQSDERLVDLTRDGNDRAFEAIVHRYRRPLLRYCGRFLPAARAEDAVQLAFVNAVAALRSSHAEIRLRPWLYRIAHNAALNVLRQAGADHDEVSEQIDGVETPPQALERGERLRTVLDAVQELPARQRDALVLQALEGRSYEEIAAELGVTGGAVRQLLNRARTTLRDAATAVTPPALLVRLGGVVEAPAAERIAQAVAGAGGGAALAKLTAVVVAGAAAVGGTVEGFLPGDDRRDRAQAAAVVPQRDAPARAGVASEPERAEQTAEQPRAPRQAIRRQDGGDAPASADRPRRRAIAVVRDEPRRAPAAPDEDDEPEADDDSSGPGSGDERYEGDDYVAPVIVEERDNSGPGSYDEPDDDGHDEPDDDDLEDRSGSNSGPG
jgi:RNA polymerase sigma factor (sigma-70 family)